MAAAALLDAGGFARQVILARQGRKTLLFAAISLVCFVPAVHAGQIWDGGGTNNNWTSPANWDGNVSPNWTLAGGISFGGETRTTPINTLAADTAVAGINFTNDGSAGKTAAFTQSGARITLGGNIVTTASSSLITDTIGFDMILNASRIVNTASGHNLTISGIISQDATNRGLTKQGVGTLTLSNVANTFAGQFLSDAGTTQVAKLENNGTASSLGAGTGSFRLGNNATATLEYIGTTDSSTNKVLQLGLAATTNTGSGAILNNGTGKLTFTAANFTAAVAGVTVARSLTLGGSYAAAANEITGVIRDTDTGTGGIVSLAKEGASTWALSGANSYTGNTTISGGTLALGASGSINNSAAISVASGATFDVAAVTGGYSLGASQVLGGSGSVLGNVTALGTIAPGTSPGTLSFENNLSLTSGSILSYELNGTDLTVGSGINDLSSVLGDLVLDGTLNVTELASFSSAAEGDSWRLFNYSGSLTNNTLSLGTMPTLSEGLGFAVDTGTAGQVNLVVTAVPEPATIVTGLIGLGLLGCVGARRRLRRLGR